jgi:large subunit ribosomal protein L10
MREEKKYLVEEVGQHLDKSNYCFLTDFTGITVDETEDLRTKLAKHDAEFHVVKNSILKLASQEREFEAYDEEWLKGQTAIVTGGENIGPVVKVLEAYHKEKDKVAVKGGVVEKKALDAQGVLALRNLPTRDELRAQLLSLFTQPGTSLVRLLNAPGSQFVTVLQRKSEQEG